MSENTTISWTNHTFNPWRGCTKVHQGCTNCYAEKEAGRHLPAFGPVIWGPNGTRVLANNWTGPGKWDRKAARDGMRARVFCASLADVFEDWSGPLINTSGQVAYRFEGGISWHSAEADVCGELFSMSDARRMLFELIDETPNLDWQLLTKRPENIRRMWYSVDDKTECAECAKPGTECQDHPGEAYARWAYRRNVHLGTSISDQASADKQIPALEECRDLAPVLFLSVEPFLEPIDLDFVCARKDLSCIDQVIIGVESRGPRVGRRGSFKSEAEWIAGAESLVDQCQAADVAVFVKQIPVNGLVEKDLAKFPASLRYREFPEVEPNPACRP